ncbi:Com family DNA-binding transcriptional regulator [Stappia sp. 28M-7]|uniref:Com family DNA-binding transcriptional regulator n=1 Tax=Stappia sp. 28M-7 TaxID=2762596 RepID=UPI00163C9903|nr:Com family DNA-binding transcriptional regulator [Stappia sp. 28M-7]
MESIRCICRRLLMRAERYAICGVIEIKCPRCGTINALRPAEPQPERPELPDRE